MKWPKTGGAPITLVQLKMTLLNQGPGHRRATIDNTHNYYLDDYTLLKIAKRGALL